ncbi:hypothetical protein ACMXYW_02780 [Neptuniibacter sp. QD48_55]|uniref:hypothetical protein n=1 Tax=Neptuniibacter sp. QD48_55 TaxID=3398212 RepID=UPI0039F44875
MRFIVPLAGKGKRSGLQYPKSLYVYNGETIFISIVKKIQKFSQLLAEEAFITLVVSSDADRELFEKELTDNCYPLKNINFVIQSSEPGTASAIYDAIVSTENENVSILVVWGDCIGFRTDTLMNLMAQPEISQLGIHIPGFFEKNCYTVFRLASGNRVVDAFPTKGHGKVYDEYTDIGVFYIPDVDFVKEALGRYVESDKVGESCFIKFIKYGLKDGISSFFYEISSKEEKQGFNSMEDIDG